LGTGVLEFIEIFFVLGGVFDNFSVSPHLNPQSAAIRSPTECQTGCLARNLVWTRIWGDWL